MPGGGRHAQVHSKGSRGVDSIVRLHLETWNNKQRLALPEMGTLTLLPPRGWSPTEDKLASTVN